ncbi:hypothetical protein AZKH_0241 [Azoarcus sp. KH32C]|nr:hypothetical protein AZKH_0241 [Azoarcus sp. KH32C]
MLRGEAAEREEVETHVSFWQVVTGEAAGIDTFSTKYPFVGFENGANFLNWGGRPKGAPCSRTLTKCASRVRDDWSAVEDDAHAFRNGREKIPELPQGGFVHETERL